MKFICKSLLVLLLLTSCAKDVEKKSLIKESDQELEMITAYKEGFENIKSGDHFFAANKERMLFKFFNYIIIKTN